MPIATLRCSARHPRISTAQSQRKRPRIGAIEARIGRATALPCCRIAVKASLRLPAIDEIRAHEAELIAIRRRIHANPELAHEERSTADLVAERLAPRGYPVHRGLGETVDIDYQRGYPMEINDPRQTAFARQVALDGLGEEGSIPDPEPVTGSEDFAFFLEKVPGGYFLIGNGTGSEGGCMVHNPGYDFDDAWLASGASFRVELTEACLKP